MVALVKRQCCYCRGAYRGLDEENPLCMGCLQAIALLGLLGSGHPSESGWATDELEEVGEGDDSARGDVGDGDGENTFWEKQWRDSGQEPLLPTIHPPGSRGKMRVMQERATRLEGVFHHADARYVGDERPVKWLLRNRALVRG